MHDEYVESRDVQAVLSSVEKSVKERLLRVYGGFREINDRADALKRAFRPWRAAQYIRFCDFFSGDSAGKCRTVAEGITACRMRVGLTTVCTAD
jgi:hypothetical protein